MLANIFMILFLLTAVILSLLVLIQRGRGGGLAGAFGGAGGSSAFGTKTADVFVKATAVLGALFFLLALVTAFAMRTEVSARTTPEATPPEAPAPAPALPGTGGATEMPAPAAPAPAAPETPKPGA